MGCEDGSHQLFSRALEGYGIGESAHQLLSLVDSSPVSSAVLLEAETKNDPQLGFSGTILKIKNAVRLGWLEPESAPSRGVM